MKTISNILLFASLIGTACLSSCTKESYGDAPKNWEGTSEYFASADEKGFSTFYTPAIGRCGDPMPFYDSKAGEFKVLYLQEYEINSTYNFHPIWGVSTKDGANYISLGEVLPTGTSIYEQDAAIGTGCCVAALFTENIYRSSFLGVFGASALWGIGELFEQQKRVERGWFPRNPKRKTSAA
jgi:beta-fructofuranosidase